MEHPSRAKKKQIWIENGSTVMYIGCLSGWKHWHPQRFSWAAQAFYGGRNSTIVLFWHIGCLSFRKPCGYSQPANKFKQQISPELDGGIFLNSRVELME